MENQRNQTSNQKGRKIKREGFMKILPPETLIRKELMIGMKRSF